MVNNEGLAKQIMEMVETLNQAASQLYDIISSGKEDTEFIQLMLTMLSKMEIPLQQLTNEEPSLMSELMSKNVISSLIHIAALKEAEPERACRKIEFELLPLLHELYVDLYFWGLCYPDKNKMWNYYKNEMWKLCPFPYIEEAERNGTYKYEVSIIVLAYNKLDYTKLCLEFLKQNFPDDVSHELILVNNGSTDGTKEYFESIHPDKQLDILHNTKSPSAVSQIIEGRYILFISNDILILPHAIENMLLCIRSDEKIGCVVPTLPNVSNLQTICAQYSNPKEMLTFAEQNNKCDPFRWEQRSRLIPPVVLARSKTTAIHAFLGYLYPFNPERFLAFTDDLMSMLLRRSGLKCILAKDAYSHHFGSVTIRENVQKNQRIYNDGRREFAKTFGMDPWGTGLCYDPAVMDAISPENCEPVNVLGVNCGMGSNPLKIKEILREKKRNQQVHVYNISDQVQYMEDLKGVSDFFQPVLNWNKAENFFSEIFFNYIIVEDIYRQKDALKIIRKMFERLSIGGKMAVGSENATFLNKINGLYQKCQRINSWIIVERSANS